MCICRQDQHKILYIALSPANASRGVISIRISVEIKENVGNRYASRRNEGGWICIRGSGWGTAEYRSQVTARVCRSASGGGCAGKEDPLLRGLGAKVLYQLSWLKAVRPGPQGNRGVSTGGVSTGAVRSNRWFVDPFQSIGMMSA